MATRTPYQGITNIIKFNRHFYLFSISLTVLLTIVYFHYHGTIKVIALLTGAAIILSTIISLIASWYVYDLSGLYKLDWLNCIDANNCSIINIHAGFDETSGLLQQKYPGAQLKIFDFYDPQKHTESSIMRARSAYPEYAGTKKINTNYIPVDDHSTDIVFAILSAHEIRNTKERITFFREIGRILKPTGQVVITEHLRDWPNLLAYNIGFFHFHSKARWLRTFKAGGFTIQQEIKINPFITTFILQQHGTAT